MTWEFDLLYAIQNMHSPILDKIMIALSTIGNAGIFWMALAVIFFITKKYRKLGINMAIAMALTYIVGNLILKNAIARQRPCWIDTDVVLLVKSPKDFSFPSGHSMNGFTGAVSIYLNDKKLGIAAIVLATLIAFSRLYNFVHFPTDVFIGAIIGICSALLVNWFMNRSKKEQVL